jgi:hypothetical protein
MKKLEQQELKQLQDLQNKSQQVILELGEISLNEILLENRKNKTKLFLNEIQDEEKTLKEFLIQKYGDNININIETGEF